MAWIPARIQGVQKHEERILINLSTVRFLQHDLLADRHAPTTVHFVDNSKIIVVEGAEDLLNRTREIGEG
jgi:hypothetical protein